jgi:hypothetical protein
MLTKTVENIRAFLAGKPINVVTDELALGNASATRATLPQSISIMVSDARRHAAAECGRVTIEAQAKTVGRA